MRQSVLHCLGCRRRDLALYPCLEYIISEQSNLGLLGFMGSWRYSLRTGQCCFLLLPQSPSHLFSSTLKRVSRKLNNQGQKSTHLDQGTLSSQLSLVVSNIWAPLFIHSVSLSLLLYLLTSFYTSLSQIFLACSLEPIFNGKKACPIFLNVFLNASSCYNKNESFV